MEITRIGPVLIFALTPTHLHIKWLLKCFDI